MLWSLPVQAQDWDSWEPIDERLAGAELLLFDGEDYHRITLSSLLGGLVEFDDGETRYLALIDGPSNLTQPTCSPSVFTGTDGKSFDGQLEPVSFPSATTFTDAWICVAVPDDVDLTYFTIGMVNSRNQLTNILEEQGPITITTADDYVAWVGKRRQSGTIFESGWYAFFSPNAVAPQP